MQTSNRFCSVCRRLGFTLVELITVSAILVTVIAILLPTIRSVREQSVRTKCASNLRQVGQYELMYCVENRGWLLLRDNAHPGTMQRMSRPSEGLFSVNLASVTSPQVWFCPNFYHFKTGQLLTEAERTALMRQHRGGYAMFGAYWDSTLQRPATNGEPIKGPILDRINMKAMRINQLKPDMVRATEWWEPLPAFGGSGGPGAELTPPHANSNGRMSGGNFLYADGSVHWSSYLMDYFGGHLYVLAMPEQPSIHRASQ